MVKRSEQKLKLSELIIKGDTTDMGEKEALEILQEQFGNAFITPLQEKSQNSVHSVSLLPSTSSAQLKSAELLKAIETAFSLNREHYFRTGFCADCAANKIGLTSPAVELRREIYEVSAG